MATKQVGGRNAPTQSQLNFIKQLFEERESENVTRYKLLYEKLTNEGKVTKANAKTLIARLLKEPKRHVPGQSPLRQKPTLDVGYYTLNGQIYTVVQNKRHSGVYSKRLITSYTKGRRARWVYDNELFRDSKKAKELTVEEASRLGHLHGICVCCGRTLDDPVSVQNGVGPVCKKRLEEQVERRLVAKLKARHEQAGVSS